MYGERIPCLAPLPIEPGIRRTSYAARLGRDASPYLGGIVREGEVLRSAPPPASFLRQIIHDGNFSCVGRTSCPAVQLKDVGGNPAAAGPPYGRTGNTKELWVKFQVSWAGGPVIGSFGSLRERH